jgi:hypothetical protein
MIDLNNLCDMINSNCKKFKIVGNSWYQEMVFQFSDIHTSWYVTHHCIVCDKLGSGFRGNEMVEKYTFVCYTHKCGLTIKTT